MSPKQKKIAAKAPPKNKIDAKDFAVLKAEKAKGRGMGLQDESIKPGKVMKAALGAVALGLGAKKLKEKGKLMPLGLGAAMMKKDKMKEILGRSKGGGADTGRMGELKSKLSVAMDRAKKGMGSRPGPSGRLSQSDIKKATDILKNKKKPKSGSSVKDIFKSYGKYDGKPIELKKGGGADMGTKMSDKRKRAFKQILERLKSPTTINIKSEYKPGTRSPMQRDRKREGYRAKVESKGGKVLFMDEMKKGGSVMARGCKLGRKKATKLY